MKTQTQKNKASGKPEMPSDIEADEIAVLTSYGRQAQPPARQGEHYQHDVRSDYTFDESNDTNTIESTPESEPPQDAYTTIERHTKR